MLTAHVVELPLRLEPVSPDTFLASAGKPMPGLVAPSPSAAPSQRPTGKQ